MDTLPLHHYAKVKQRGAALMVMIVIVVAGAAAALVGSLSSTALKNARQEKTAAALAQAKEALIGYAITYGDTNGNKTHGYLPCPDINETGITPEGIEHGVCGITNANAIGRLPWKSLGLPPLHDEAGECLWYAVSGTYKSNPPTNERMNWDNTGKLKVFSVDGNEIAPEEIVALIIAPGPVLPNNTPNQNRSGAAAPICGGNYVPEAYLDNDPAHNINNSDIAIAKFIVPHEHRDANGNVTSSTNDQLIYITRQDIWSAIQKRIAREAKKCLDNYASDNSDKYPWAAPVTDTTFYASKANTLFGRLPKHQSITNSNINAMMDAITALQAAVNNCKVANNSGNRNALSNAGNILENAAEAVRDSQPTSPAITSSVTTPAITAGDKAMDNSRCSDILNNPSGNSVQTNLDSANNAISALPPSFNWPGSCTLFSSASWNHWKDLVFYQVAAGFKPGGGTASCGSSCLSVEGGGHNVAGSGSYRATVIAAGKKLGANRSAANVADYLEPDNLLPKDNTIKPYKTHRVTDAAYQPVNDFVLCLDGKVNCQ